MDAGALRVRGQVVRRTGRRYLVELVVDTVARLDLEDLLDDVLGHMYRPPNRWRG